ncbi:ABC transporter family substrate-binding protein [Nocardia sp. CA2R105]|uniref:ABC transporter family substrate-binding protein n=1 Tax=Nocardia coffeae TaxID=2873381 RepID=UPI001CA63EF9|nr:ABC transporter family substrate-binding protein [Nocardia coffeae]MBY8858715.1 ABC transporter family substrate-binding protein [Nocardia coffeae]
MKRRTFGKVVAAASVSALAAACSSGTGSTGSATLGTTNDINPQPRGNVREGGNLRLAITAIPSNWNVQCVDGNEGETADLIRWTMPRAFKADPAGQLTIDTDYFTDIKLTSTNPQQVVYTINPKAVWSDGTPITWEDLAATWQALNGRDKDYLYAISNGFDRVEKVERGVDDRQAVLTFSTPYADWRGQYSGNSILYPKSVSGTPDSFNHSLVDHMGPSAGPFVVQSIDRTQRRIVLARNPKWWGAPPKLDTVTYSVLDQSTWAAALQNNELDLARMANLNDVLLIRRTAGLQLRHAPMNMWRWLTFNGAPGSILSDPALRVAIAKAINRQAIADTSLAGLTDHPKVLNNHVFVMGQKGYQDNSAPVAYDPAAAARQLDDLGWKLQGDVRVKDGRQLAFRDVMYNDPGWVAIAKMIQSDLAKIGVKMSIDTRPGQDYFTNVIIPGDFDTAQYVLMGDVFVFNSIPQEFGLYPNNVQGNYGRIGSPALNDLIDKALSELDPDKAIALANQVDTQIFAEGHSLPLTQDPGNWATRATLANIGAPGLGSYDYTAIGFAK